MELTRTVRSQNYFFICYMITRVNKLNIQVTVYVSVDLSVCLLICLSVYLIAETLFELFGLLGATSACYGLIRCVLASLCIYRMDGRSVPPSDGWSVRNFFFKFQK